ncbi:YndM family protein [Peribacillus glennii]|uniref:DUF2512 family protein n=1 Tax=Peribacillus glennii TaxID=2303991 RepID=A0A372L6U6_9BACI|nr:YndM family protein [Peribacillus glennii]RFU60861.1 DUF2512 family protein [Peribacillus glennii]
MRHVIAFFIKFLSTLVVLGIILGLFFNYSIMDVLTISIVLSAVGYMLGDLFLYRRTNNMTATISDFGLAFLVVWFMSLNITFEDDLLTASILAAAGVAIYEYFYHRVVPRARGRRRETNENRNQRQTNARYRTEASEDLTIARPDVRSPKGKENNQNEK